MKDVYLQQYIAQNSQLSRRNAEDLVRNKKSKVNGKIGELGQKVSSAGDKVEIFDTECSTWNILRNIVDKRVYYLVNKPVGYVCTVRDEHAQKKVIDLVPRTPKVYPAGRLDKNTSGFIILTNDGDFTYKLTHPKFEVEKEYIVRITLNDPSGTYDANSQNVPRGTLVTEENVKKLRELVLKGVELEDGLAKADKIYDIHKLSTIYVEMNMVLHSGKKRIIRRIFDALGWKVVRLERIRVGAVKLDVKLGKYRLLQSKEVEKLIN